MRTELLMVAALAFVAGCGSCPHCRRDGEDGARAAETVVVEGCALRLEAELWRDFQPVAPPDGQPMMAVVRLAAEDGASLPAGVSVTRVWFASEGKQWTPKPAAGATGNELHFAGGPKWGPGTTADVVVELARGKETWRLGAYGVPIKRVD